MVFEFAGCLLDTSLHRLTRDGEEVHVEPQVFDLLVLLAGAEGALVTYDQIVEQVWNGRIVSDATLAARISAARAALGDNGRAQAVIRTVPTRGVQLVVPVTRQGAAAAGPAVQQTIRYTRSRDGTGLAFAVSGQGRPLLRAGHWLSHLEHDWQSPVWRPLLDRLGEGRSLVRYDPRGTGLSDRTLGAATLEHFIDDLEAVADAAGLDRFPIYAISQSVPIALGFAARRPERVERLVLFNGFLRGSTARGDRANTEMMVELIESGWGVADSPFMRAFATLFMPRSTQEELQSLVEMQAVSADPAVAAQLRRIIGDFDVSGLLGKITAPALVAHCSGDAIQSIEQSRQLAQGLADAQFKSWDSPNHVIAPSDPIFTEQLDASIRFLDS